MIESIIKKSIGFMVALSIIAISVPAFAETTPEVDSNVGVEGRVRVEVPEFELDDATIETRGLITLDLDGNVTPYGGAEGSWLFEDLDYQSVTAIGGVRLGDEKVNLDVSYRRTIFDDNNIEDAQVLRTDVNFRF